MMSFDHGGIPHREPAPNLAGTQMPCANKAPDNPAEALQQIEPDKGPAGNAPDNHKRDIRSALQITKSLVQ